jgi:transposase
MKTGTASTKTRAPELAANVAALAQRVQSLESERDALARQVEWFKRQLFGSKSEKRTEVPAAQQSLLAGLVPSDDTAEDSETVTVKRRRAKRRDDGCVNETGLRFDESVPVKVIELSAPELDGPNADDYEVITHKHTFRLASRPATYVVLNYVRPVVKRRSTQQLLTVPAPSALWDGGLADVSIIVAMLLDKFLYHMPLYRQHQRLRANGIELSPTTLTNWVQRASALLVPIYQAQLRNILLSKVLAMDETPIKAGRNGKGRMKSAWFWPVYGDQDELAFTFSPTKGRKHIDTVLGDFQGTLLTDGAPAYARYAAGRPGVTHAQCWAHTRRTFFEARQAEPELVDEALALIGALYEVEAHIKDQGLTDGAKLNYRTEHAHECVAQFFAWCDRQCNDLEQVPNDPFIRALHYALERQSALSVFLSEPDVAIDTNHLERGLRPIPMGRKSWLFCTSEIGAKHVGVIQSLLTTCRLHDVDPNVYLTDVLQRIARKHASPTTRFRPTSNWSLARRTNRARPTPRNRRRQLRRRLGAYASTSPHHRRNHLYRYSGILFLVKGGSSWTVHCRVSLRLSSMRMSRATAA